MPSVSLEPEPVKATVRGTLPAVGVAVAAAVGAWLAATSTVVDAVVVAPPSSVTVRVTTWVPTEV